MSGDVNSEVQVWEEERGRKWSTLLCLTYISGKPPGLYSSLTSNMFTD